MNKPCFIAVTNRNLCKRPFFDVIEDLSKKDVKKSTMRSQRNVRKSVTETVLP